MTDDRDVAAALHSAAIHLLRAVRHADTASGLSPARLSALSVIVFGGPISIGDLAKAEQVRSPTMTSLVNALAADGLAARGRDPGDRRGVRVAATARGRKVLQKTQKRRLDVLRQRMAGLSADDVALLARAAALMEGCSAGPNVELRGIGPRNG
jgi:DNA-binding MarR family transcriptional regulator